MRTLLIISVAVMGSGCVRTVVVPPLQNVAVRGFVAHAERDWPGTPQQQALTADTLDWLASAIESLATTRQLTIADLPARMQRFRSVLKEFAAGEPDRLEQTLALRQLFSSGSQLLADLMVAAALEDDARALAADVRNAADALDEGRLPSEQAAAIETYFREASRALQRVDRGA